MASIPIVLPANLILKKRNETPTPTVLPSKIVDSLCNDVKKLYVDFLTAQLRTSFTNLRIILQKSYDLYKDEVKAQMDNKLPVTVSLRTLTTEQVKFENEIKSMRWEMYPSWYVLSVCLLYISSNPCTYESAATAATTVAPPAAPFLGLRFMPTTEEAVNNQLKLWFPQREYNLANLSTPFLHYLLPLDAILGEKRFVALQLSRLSEKRIFDCVWNLEQELKEEQKKLPTLFHIKNSPTRSTTFRIDPVLFPPHSVEPAPWIEHRQVLLKLTGLLKEKLENLKRNFESDMKSRVWGSNYDVDVQMIYMRELFNRLLSTTFYFEVPALVLAEIATASSFLSAPQKTEWGDYASLYVLFLYLYSVYTKCAGPTSKKFNLSFWTEALNSASTSSALLPSLDDENSATALAWSWTDVNLNLKSIELTFVAESKKVFEAQANLNLSTPTLTVPTSTPTPASSSMVTSPVIATSKTDHLKIISWNVCSFHFSKSPSTSTNCPRKMDKQDPADPQAFYTPLFQPIRQEERLLKLYQLLAWLTRESDKTPDFICLQQVPQEFVEIFLTPKQIIHSKLFYKVTWSPLFEAIFAIDQVVTSSKSLPFAGKQGILVLYRTDRFLVAPESVVHLPSPFSFYLGTGSIQLYFLVTRLLDQAKLLFAASESYPQSWPLLIPSVFSTSVVEAKVSSSSTQKRTLTFLALIKPGITLYRCPYKDELKNDIFDPAAFLDFIRKYKFLSETSLQGEPDSSHRYPNDVNRYRFLLVRRKDLHIQNLGDFQRKVLTLPSTLTPFLQGDSFSQVFDSDCRLLVIDAMFIAESDSLFFHERLSSLYQLHKEPSILCCLTQPYDSQRSNLVNYAAGTYSPWDSQVDIQLVLQKVFTDPTEVGTWWLPCSPDCSKVISSPETLTYFNTQKRKYKKETVSSCQSGPVVDHILY